MREKEEFIREFNEAFSRNDLEFILDHMSEDIVWNFLGENIMHGKEEVREFMKSMSKVETLELEILHIITHGWTAAANGRMKIKEPTGETKSFGFADIYVFNDLKSLKIKEMTSYVVGIKEGQNKRS